MVTKKTAMYVQNFVYHYLLNIFLALKLTGLRKYKALVT